MHIRRVATLSLGLFALAAIGIADVGVSSNHGQTAGAPDKAGSMMMGGKSGPMLAMPMMNPALGRKLFASKGCVVCHSINGIGGEDAPSLDAKTMSGSMNPFDFAAKMWRGAQAMIAVQQEELGEQIEFSGDELANIIAFVHSPDEQKKFTTADIPPRIKKLMSHMGDQDDEHKKEHEAKD